MQQQIAQDKILQLQAGLAKIKQRFIGTLPLMVEELDELIEILNDGGDVPKVFNAIRFRAHKLHGQSGSFGFDAIGAAAAKLEHKIDALMKGPQPMPTQEVENLTTDLVDMIDAALAES